MDEAVTYPGAQRAERRRQVSAWGLELAVHEWGDPDGPPLLLCHGGFDFAATFDGFAPLLAAAGWRVVAWDQRGHGDSEHAVLYSWDADVRDALAVLDSTTRRPIPFVGHSKGGSLMTQLAEANPHRCSALVNLEGLPSRRNLPDIADHERTRLLQDEIAGWLDHRAGAGGRSRRPDTLDGLAARRGRMNPRLSPDWLRYLVSVGGRHDADGWRWKIDPVLRPGGFGPWRPEWSMMRLPGVSAPVLGVLAEQPEPMGWGTRVEDVTPWLPPGGEVVSFPDLGHFVHIEAPERIASLVLDFLGPPAGRGGWGPVASGRPAPPVDDSPPPPASPPALLTHARSRLALHELRGGDSGPPLLVLHGLGERAPRAIGTPIVAWPGPIHALDFTGHGQSTMPVGGGYTAEILMGDADAALHQLGRATVYGRGLGAYVALLLAGARSSAVDGVILADGPGLSGGGGAPGSPVSVGLDADASGPPDPFALGDLARDIRPPDYATAYARLAIQGSRRDHPIIVTAVNRPPWLDAVVAEPGVTVTTAEKAVLLAAADGRP